MGHAQSATGTDHSAAPSATSADEKMLRHIVKRLTHTAMIWHTTSNGREAGTTSERRSNYTKRFTAIIRGYSPATVQRLAGRFIDREYDFIADSLISHDETEEFINDLIVFRRNIIDSTELGFPTKRSLYLRGISHYDHIEPQTGGDYPERRIAQGTAILRVTAHLKSQGIKNEGVSAADGRKYARITDPVTRTLLTTHEDPTMLADLIIDRNLTTGTEIKSVLDTMNTLSAPLRAGSL